VNDAKVFIDAVIEYARIGKTYGSLVQDSAILPSVPSIMVLVADGCPIVSRQEFRMRGIPEAFGGFPMRFDKKIWTLSYAGAL
jgi:hypothetical protein